MFRSKITLKETTLVFIVIHLGEHNFIGGTKLFISEDTFHQIKEEICNSLLQNNIPDLIIRIDKHFDAHSFSLRHLFRDGKRKVLYTVLNEALTDVGYEYRQLYKRYSSLVTAMKELHIPPPQTLEFPIQFTLNNELKECFSKMDFDENRIRQIIAEMNQGKIKPETKILSIIIGELLMRYLEEIEKNPFDMGTLKRTNMLFSIITPLSLSLDLRKCQNSYFRVGEMMCPRMKQEKESGDEGAKEWLDQYLLLGNSLGIICN